jgi:uncharacterized protein
MSKAWQRDEDGPMRTCIVTREQHTPDAMIRFVLSPEKIVTADLSRKLPGRGVWLTPTRMILEKALATKAFARSFKEQVQIYPDFANMIGDLLYRQFLEGLALANKAGAIIAGFDKVESAIESGKVVVMMHTIDAAEDGRRKLAQRVYSVQKGNLLCFRDLPSEDLDLALGRNGVRHACLLAGPATPMVLARYDRWVAFEGESPIETSPQGDEMKQKRRKDASEKAA